MTTTAIRLPGIYFLPSDRPAAPELPPLDVAAFVGFAERGPLDVPVAVEDIDTYQAIFGDDLALAREEDRTVYANLPTAVSTFFANGGRRCYVVRVAGDSAGPTRLSLPGLISLDEEGGDDPRLTPLWTASPGKWGEKLRIGSRLITTPLPPTVFTISGSNSLTWQTGSAPQAIQPGDILRMVYGDQVILFPVTAVTTPTPEPPKQLTLQAERPWAAITAANSGPLYFIPGEVTRLTFDEAEALDVTARLDQEEGLLHLYLSGDDMETVVEGDVLWLQEAGSPGYLFPITNIQAQGDQGSPPVLESLSTADYMLSLADNISLPQSSPLESFDQVDRLRFELYLWYDETRYPTINEMAFNSGHPRFWGETLLFDSSGLRKYAPADPDGSQAAEASKLHRQLQARKRTDDLPTELQTIALAGLLAPINDEENGRIHLPLGMAAILREDALTRPDEADIGHNGLETFTESYFLDPDLMGVGHRTLLSEAFAKYYVDNDRLLGLHSLLYINEVALLSLPDAAHRSWPDETPPAEEAVLDITAVTPPSGTTCGGDTVLIQGTGLDKGPLTVTFGENEAATVQIITDGLVMAITPASEEAGPVTVSASNNLGETELENGFTYVDPACIEVEKMPFESCGLPPEITAVLPNNGDVKGGETVAILGERLDGDLGVVQFGDKEATNLQIISEKLVTAVTPESSIAGPITVTYTSSLGQAELPDGFNYFRPTTPPLPTLPGIVDYNQDTLLALQKEMLNFCQARRDVVSIFSLPPHFEKRQCIEWQQDLRQELRLPAVRVANYDDQGMLPDLSYAAVYHPWLYVAGSDSENLRPIPPDGTACGLIARRELERSVWVAPANQPSPNILSLTPPFPEADWAELFERQFNFFRREARDFRVMSAHTLADDPKLMQLSVRRLLILLRKIALELGMDFVFDNNDQRLWRNARLQLEGMLQDMFIRGAFAGASTQEAYRVNTGPNINTRQRLDLGQFHAQIQVAPSQPMEFITVLLTRSSEGAIRAVEAI